MTEMYPIIGMSPGNSYFKDPEVRYLLQKVIAQYGECAVLVADVPAIATYEGFGYPKNRARRKAIPKGNNLKNRTRRIQKELGIADEVVRIIDWEREVESHPEYKKVYNSIQELYESNEDFKRDVRSTTQQVIEKSGREVDDMEAAIDVSIHYLLSEFAFLEWAPNFLEKKHIGYVYHKKWPVYQKYIAGMYDEKKKDHLEFILLENPYETFAPLHRKDKRPGMLRASFAHYPPAFIKSEKGYSGILHDLIKGYAEENALTLEWIEETGYGVIVDGLNDGRFDIFASTVWPIPERQDSTLFSESLYDSPVFLWVRKDEKWSEQDIRSTEFSIAVRENDISDSIRKIDFSQTRSVKQPQLGTMDDLLGAVSSGVADGTFAETAVVEEYNQHADVQLERYNEEPIRVYENCFLMDSSNTSLAESLNTYLRKQKENGTVEQLIKTYCTNPKDVRVFK